MQKLARRLPGVDEETLWCVVVRGLRPSLKAHVLQHQPTSLGQILEAARFAEVADIANADATGNELSQLMDEVRASRAEVQQLATRVDKMATSTVHSRPPTPSRQTGSRASLQQVTFAESLERRDQRPVPSSEPRGDRYIYRGRRQPSRQQEGVSRQPFPCTTSTAATRCGLCGSQHDGICPALRMTCRYCRRRGHVQATCRSASRPSQSNH